MILHPYTFSFRAQSSCTIRAYFKLHKQLTITVEASPAEGGSVSGGGTYYSFDRAPLSASPGDDYEFLYWAVGDNIISYNANYNYIVYENGEVLTAHFVQVGIKYPLWVGNTQVASNRVSGDCWSYSGDGASGTLTLTNANITSAHYYNDDVNLSNICVYAPLKLTINLVGENRIDCNDWEAICGICAMSGNLTITGEGSLNICNKWGQCIYAYELAVRGPTLTAESPNDKSICVNNTLTIENSVVNVTSIETDALVIQNSDVYATTESGLAIYTHQSIAVGGNSLVIAETKSGNRAIEYRRDKSTGEEYFTLGEGLAVTTPENYTTGPYNDSSTGTRMTIKNQDGSNAKRVVIRNINVPALFGSGTSDAPYRIGSADDWKELADFAEAHNTANLYFMQTADITQAVTAQIPAFSGVYDGGRHTLNVSISGGECAAPFHSLSGATVRNLTVTGTVSGSIHCAGLAGCLEGNCALHNVEVAVNVTTGGTHCGGLIGHGGSANTATVENCVFSGTIGGATHAGTLWGWSDGGNISLSGCLDVSACDYPIGLGFGTVHVENTCYTNPDKKAGTSRPWTDRGAMAYSISGEDGITLILTGETGIPRGGVIYAPAGEVISLNALAEPWDGYDLVFSASAGTLTQTDTGLALNMPGEAVVISLLRVPHFSISPAVSLTIDDNSGGYANEGAENLFDGRDDTKWCVRYNGSNWVEFHTEYQVMPSAYAMKTAGDTARYPGRNPTSWRLLGRQSAGDAWTTLAEKTNDTTMPAENCVQRFFPLSVSGRYQYYRFEILAICSESTLQLSEFNLIGSPSFCTPDFNLPANLTTVEAEAFEGIGAGVVFVPDDCESIGDYAFRDCPNLKQIRIPAGCTLGADVFDGCGWVYVYGTAGSPAEVYCQAHENCNFVEEVRN